MMDQDKQDNQDQTNYYTQQDEEYGLPVAEYSPLEHEQPVAGEEESAEEYMQPSREINLKPEEESHATWPIWTAVIVLFAAGAFALYYFVFNKQEAQVITPAVTNVVVEPEPEPIVEETPAPVEEWVPPVEKEGSVTAISGRTGRYYVVIGSFIDGDLAKDYADKLAAQGAQVSLIEPSGNRKFYRLGVLDAPTFSEANDELDNLKMTYGEDIWVYRY